MLETCNISTVITINSTDLITKDPHETLMKFIRRKYEGRCYQKRLIIRVIELKGKGFAEISRDRGNGHVDVSVIFEAETATLTSGECITCKITDTTSKTFAIGVSEIANVSLKLDKKIPIENGVTVPVIVEDVAYVPFNQKISVKAVTFYNTKQIDLKIKILPASEPFELSKSIIAEIEQLRAEKYTRKSDILQIFFPLEKLKNPIEMKNIPTIKNPVTIDLKMSDFTNGIFEKTTEEFDVEMHAEDVAKDLLHYVLKQLQEIDSLCIAYENNQDFNKVRNIFGVFLNERKKTNIQENSEGSTSADSTNSGTKNNTK